jgi:hypothetical protein
VSFLGDGMLFHIPIQSAQGGSITTTYTDLVAAMDYGLKAVGLTNVTVALTAPFSKIDVNTGQVITGGQTITLSAVGSVLSTDAGGLHEFWWCVC